MAGEEDEKPISVQLAEMKKYLGAKIDEGHDKLNANMAAMNTRVCLLYTSPSPRDLSTSRMPSSA